MDGRGEARAGGREANIPYIDARVPGPPGITERILFFGASQRRRPRSATLHPEHSFFWQILSRLASKPRLQV